MASVPTPAIDRARLLARLDAFAAIGAAPDGGVDRQAFTEADREARRLFAEIALARGFEVVQDQVSNLFIRRRSRNSDQPALLIGSHLDTQPTGGRYDGALGTLAAFEVLEALHDAGTLLERPVEVVAWSNEEGCRFAPGSMGSQVFAGALSLADILNQTASDGAKLGDELAATIASLPQVPLRDRTVRPSSYLELHIEQGPILERESIPIGIVTGVQGTRWLEVRIDGEAGHAGTTPLASRRDPLAAAAAALARLYATVMPGDEAARFTVGRMTVSPGSINAIPASVSFSVDIRHPDASALDDIEARLRAVIDRASRDGGCIATISQLFDMPPMQFSGPLLESLEEAADRRGAPHRRMVSGAFHDALFMARVVPAAMLFVPCRGGISHNPAEYVEPDHAVLGAQVLLEAVLALAGARKPEEALAPAQ